MGSTHTYANTQRPLSLRDSNLQLELLTCREEGEKFNIWVAWLNLENLYGDPAEEAVMGLFRRALAANPQKALYMALINILERSQKVPFTLFYFGKELFSYMLLCKTS